MSQNVTEVCREPSEDQPELGSKQMAVLENLLRGSTATEAAQAAGVNRRTVWRWRRTDIEFQAAFNRSRREAWEAAQMRLERLVEVAIGAVERAVADGDVRTALAVLRGLHFLTGEP